MSDCSPVTAEGKPPSDSFMLSIVIPTRNRGLYALAAARQCLSLSHPQIQIVIQDNSDDDSLRAMCSQLSSGSHLIYNHSPGTLSFVENFSTALGLATGEYITIIGDDDGINPEIITAVQWAHGKKIGAIKPGLQAMYFWPDVGLEVTKGAGDSGILLIEPVTGDTRLRKTIPELERLLKDGCQEYLRRDLAKAYHGIVRRDVLEEVRQVTGHFFGGLSPDIYATVALSSVVEEVVCIDYPLTIPGVCRTSGSADSVTGRHTGRIEDAPHFVGHTSYEWASEVPEFYGVETIWADSGLAAAADMQRTDLLQLFRVEYLSAFCMRRHPEYSSLITQHYFRWQQQQGASKLQALGALAGAHAEIMIRLFFDRIRWRLSGRSRGPVELTGIEDISSASLELSQYLKRQGLSITTCLAHLDEALASSGVAR